MLNCSISKEGDIEIVYLEGNLDATTADVLSKTLLDFFEAGRHQIILEMGGVSYISSNGLRPLLEWLEATQQIAGRRRLVVCNLHEFIKEVFKITEFDLKLPIYEDAESALGAFKQNI